MTPPRRCTAALLAAATLVAALSACGGSNNNPDPSSTVTSRPTTSSAATSTATSSAGADAQTGPVPDLDVTPAAASTIGAENVHAAWTALAEWILDTGFDTDLVRATNPTAAQLGPVTALMTARCAAAFQADVAAKTETAIGSIEAVTAVGVTAPDATPVAGEDLVTDRAITNATADVTAGALTIAAVSSANIHYAADADPTRRTHATFERRTTYTLVQQGNRWLVENWQGTYTTSDPIAD